MGRVLTIGMVGVALLAAGAVKAQSIGEITIYSQGHFKGSSLGLAGPMTHIDPPFTVKSVQITPGSAWELCSGNTFTGCRRIDKSIEAGVFSVRSLRPIAPVIREPSDPVAPHRLPARTSCRTGHCVAMRASSSSPPTAAASASQSARTSRRTCARSLTNSARLRAGANPSIQGLSRLVMLIT